MQNPILIVSAPRSGSSLTSLLISRAGVFGGDTKKGNKWNRKGYFENLAIADLEIEYLRRSDTEGLLKRFQPINLDEPFPDFNVNVCRAIRQQGLTEGGRWYYKNPKTAMLWRLWHRNFPFAKWVIVKRNRADTIRSLKHTEFMDAYETDDQWNQFLDYYDSLLGDIQNNCDSFTLDIDRVFSEGLPPVEELFNFLGDLSTDNVLECVEPSLWNYGNR